MKMYPKEFAAFLLSEPGLIDAKTIAESAKVDFRMAVSGDGIIHEFIFLAICFFPDSIKRSWHSRGVFLLYHQEAFHAFHRSFLEAFCASYQTSFTLLRSALEMVLKGAFYEGLAHKKFRENTNTLGQSKLGSKLKCLIEKTLKEHPNLTETLEENSVGLLDVLDVIFKYYPKVKRIPVQTIISQMNEWGLFEPIDNPITTVYNEIYGKLSDYVHALPDKIDVGTRLLKCPEEIFKEYKVIPERLKEYLKLLHMAVDASMLVLINLLINGFEESTEIKTELLKEISNPRFKDLNLKWSVERLKAILRS